MTEWMSNKQATPPAPRGAPLPPPIEAAVLHAAPIHAGGWAGSVQMPGYCASDAGATHFPVSAPMVHVAHLPPAYAMPPTYYHHYYSYNPQPHGHHQACYVQAHGDPRYTCGGPPRVYDGESGLPHALSGPPQAQAYGDPSSAYGNHNGSPQAYSGPPVNHAYTHAPPHVQAPILPMHQYGPPQAECMHPHSYPPPDRALAESQAAAAASRTSSESSPRT